MARLCRFLQEDVRWREPEWEEEMPETFIVSDVVEGISVDAVTLVPSDRVQQGTAEPMVELPQFPGETVDAVTLVPRERVQQRTAEKIGEVPASQDRRLQRTVEQYLNVSVEVDKDVLPERVSERISEQGGLSKYPRTVEQYLDVSVEVDKNVLQERISERMCDQISREHLQWGFWVYAELCGSCARRVEASKVERGAVKMVWHTLLFGFFKP